MGKPCPERNTLRNYTKRNAVTTATDIPNEKKVTSLEETVREGQAWTDTRIE